MVHTSSWLTKSASTSSLSFGFSYAHVSFAFASTIYILHLRVMFQCLYYISPPCPFIVTPLYFSLPPFISLPPCISSSFLPVYIIIPWSQPRSPPLCLVSFNESVVLQVYGEEELPQFTASITKVENAWQDHVSGEKFMKKRSRSCYDMTTIKERKDLNLLNPPGSFKCTGWADEELMAQIENISEEQGIKEMHLRTLGLLHNLLKEKYQIEGLADH